MNKVAFPTFFGTTAKIAADRWAQHHIATQLLNSVNVVSDNVLSKLSRTYDPIEMLEQGIIKPEEIPLTKHTLSNSDFLFSFLYSIPGIGEKSASELVYEFGTLSVLADVSYEELKEISHIGKERAKIVSKYLDRIFD